MAAQTDIMSVSRPDKTLQHKVKWCRYKGLTVVSEDKSTSLMYSWWGVYLIYSRLSHMSFKCNWNWSHTHFKGTREVAQLSGWQNYAYSMSPLSSGWQSFVHTHMTHTKDTTLLTLQIDSYSFIHALHCLVGYHGDTYLPYLCWHTSLANSGPEE